MVRKTTIDPATLSDLRVLHYPDPRLRQKAATLAPADLDDSVRALVERMYELMVASRGVGLAATQLGVGLRLFVACPTDSAADRRAYLNPRIVACDGSLLTEEGCLSVPGIHCKIKRYAKVTLEAMDTEGGAFTVEAEELLARIFQHETDHLEGKLLVDRMGTVARLSHRTTLKQLEEDFAEAQADAQKAAAR
jgi:peptide deformylase